MENLPGNPTAGPDAQGRLGSEAVRLRRSLRFAVNGFLHAWREQPNLRLECAAALTAILLALWLRTGLVAVLLASALVIAVELVNSAIEAIIDLVSPQRHALAGAAKDLAAAAVLVASAGAFLIGLVALGPELLRRLGALM